MRNAFLASFLLLFSGCVSTDPAFLASGQPVVRITCGLAIDRMQGCFRVAGDICGQRGFVIYDWNGDPWPKPYPDPDTLQHAMNLPYDGLLIACGPRGG